MVDDATRRTILARRARFVAAAMVGIGVAGCDKPQPCLSVDRKPTASGSPTADDTSEPHACLKVGKTPVDEATDAGARDAPAASEPKPDARPEPPKAQPCLKIGKPLSCLSPVDDDGR